MAAMDRVLIKEWVATRLMKSVPNVLSVRVCAPMDFRLRVMMKRLGIARLRNDLLHVGRYGD